MAGGGYFTWNPLNDLHVDNNMRWPDYYMVDLKIDKKVKFLGTTASFFIDISNLFNFKVSMMSDGYCFERESGDLEEWGDFINYLASLHLPMYKSSDYDGLRNPIPDYMLLEMIRSATCALIINHTSTIQIFILAV
jgi:hypothetical protein